MVLANRYVDVVLAYVDNVQNVCDIRLCLYLNLTDVQLFPTFDGLPFILWYYSTDEASCKRL